MHGAVAGPSELSCPCLVEAYRAIGDCDAKPLWTVLVLVPLLLSISGWVRRRVLNPSRKMASEHGEFAGFRAPVSIVRVCVRGLVI